MLLIKCIRRTKDGNFSITISKCSAQWRTLAIYKILHWLQSAGTLRSTNSQIKTRLSMHMDTWNPILFLSHILGILSNLKIHMDNLPHTLLKTFHLSQYSLQLHLITRRPPCKNCLFYSVNHLVFWPGHAKMPISFSKPSSF